MMVVMVVSLATAFPGPSSKPAVSKLAARMKSHATLGGLPRASAAECTINVSTEATTQPGNWLDIIRNKCKQ